MVNRYNAGREFEYRTRDHLTSEGYWVMRAAGSKTKADLIAIKPGQVLFVQCKRDGKLPPAERIEVRRLASLLPGIAVPILAYQKLRPSRVVYAELTGNGPKDRRDWTTDEVTP